RTRTTSASQGSAQANQYAPPAATNGTVNAGLTSPTPCTGCAGQGSDIKGITRPRGGAWDAGAYQFTGGTRLPAITSPPTASGIVGTAFSYQITATNSATSFGATGLPAGLSVSPGTGLISGTPTAAAWIKPSSANGYVMSRRNTSASVNSMSWELYLNGGKVVFTNMTTAGPNPDATATSAGVVDTSGNVWTHMAATYNSADSSLR